MTTADDLALRALAAAHGAAVELSEELAGIPAEDVNAAIGVLLGDEDEDVHPGAGRRAETWEGVAAMHLVLAAQCLGGEPGDDGTPDRAEALDVIALEGWRALDAGDTGGATAAGQALLDAATDEDDWNYGNLVHDGHLLIGFALLAVNDQAGAAEHLRAAGRTPGSPQLDSFGPDLSLAFDLLRAGEGAAVLDYLTSISRFWSPGSLRRR